jgi:TP901 family phage tail tape measure protein
MAQYQVDYLINVNAGNAVAEVDKFLAATQKLQDIAVIFENINSQAEMLRKALTGLKVTIDASEANSTLDALLIKAERLSTVLKGGTAATTSATKRTSTRRAAFRDGFIRDGNKLYYRGANAPTIALPEGQTWQKTQLMPKDPKSLTELQRVKTNYDRYQRVKGVNSLSAQKMLRLENSLSNLRDVQRDVIHASHNLTRLNSVNPNKLTPEKAARLTRLIGENESILGFLGMLHGTPSQISTNIARLERVKKNNPLSSSRLQRIEKAQEALRFRESVLTSGWVAADAKTGRPVPTALGGKSGASGAKKFQPSPSNLSYKLLGATPLPNTGGMAIDMLKGMGIAYGLTGLMSGIGDIVNSATDYDNTMATVSNILGSHDKRADFDSRFSRMQQVVKQIGVQTKFKVTEVADAAKFLAMAGLSVDDISTAMIPISDIALVGDSDLGETADLVTNIMTSYGMKSSQMMHTADVMTNTFTRSNVTLNEIAESYKYAGSLLKAGGISFEEATAGLGLLGDAGMKGSQAGTIMRTILSNLVKPTKSMEAEWQRLGIQRTDSNGNLRNLADIFADISKNPDVKVDSFFKLFNKTAAQGAVALAANVDKWNELVKTNFMSDGLVDELAEKKKNTIAGLWAQLTSTLTDDGVEAFKGIQDPIKNMLRNLTAWLGTTEAKDKITEIFQDFKHFVDIISEVSVKFYHFYDTYKPFITFWMKLQLLLLPLVKTLTAVKSLFYGVAAIFRSGFVMRNMAAMIGAIHGEGLKGTAFRGLGKKLVSGGALPIFTEDERERLENRVLSRGNVGSTTILSGGSGLGNTKPGSNVGNSKDNPGWWKRHMRMSGWQSAGAVGMSGVGGVLGYILGDTVGSAFTSDDSGIGGMIGSAVGSAGGAGLAGVAYQAASGIPGLLGAAGAVAGVAAVIALLAAGFKQFNDNTARLQEGVAEWTKTINNFNFESVKFSNIQDVLSATMRVRYGDIRNENTILTENIRLWKEAYDQHNENNLDDKTPLKDTAFGAKYGDLTNTEFWNGYSMKDRIKDIAEAADIPLVNGKYDFGNGTIIDPSAASARDLIYAAQYSVGKKTDNPYVTQYADQLASAFTTAKTVDELRNKINEAHKSMAQKIAWDKRFDVDDLEDAQLQSLADIMHSRAGHNALSPIVNRMFNGNMAIVNLLDKYKNDAFQMPLSDWQNTMATVFPILNKKYGTFGTTEWYTKISKDYSPSVLSGMFDQAWNWYTSTTMLPLKQMLLPLINRGNWIGTGIKGLTLGEGGVSPGTKDNKTGKDENGRSIYWVPTPYAIMGSANAWAYDKEGKQPYLPGFSKYTASQMAKIFGNGDYSDMDLYQNTGGIMSVYTADGKTLMPNWSNPENDNIILKNYTHQPYNFAAFNDAAAKSAAKGKAKPVAGKGAPLAYITPTDPISGSPQDALAANMIAYKMAKESVPSIQQDAYRLSNLGTTAIAEVTRDTNFDINVTIKEVNMNQPLDEEGLGTCINKMFQDAWELANPNHHS